MAKFKKVPKQMTKRQLHDLILGLPTHQLNVLHELVENGGKAVASRYWPEDVEISKHIADNLKGLRQIDERGSK